MSEIEKHNPILTDSSVTARPATEHDTGKNDVAGEWSNGDSKGGGDSSKGEEKDDDIRGRPGVAPVKAQYLLSNASTSYAEGHDDDAAEGRPSSPSSGHVDGRSAKRQKTDDRDRAGGTGKDKKKNRGQNKNRPAPITREPGPKLCRAWELGRCDRDRCAFQHSWAGYFEEKPRDVLWPVGYLDDMKEGESEGYAVYPASIPGDGESKESGNRDIVGATIDLATKCPVLTDLGYCPFGFRCRFAGAHVARADSGAAEAGIGENGESTSTDAKLAGGWRITADLHDPAGTKVGWRMNETNWPESSLLTRLRTDKYDFPMSRQYLTLTEPDKPYTLSRNYKPPKPPVAMEEVDEEAMLNAMMGASEGAEPKGIIDGQSEKMDVPLRPEEKKRLDWREELYLAPLTTVGNLPFRRLCTSLGASITISEMALAQPLISGQSDEWALCRRHASEKTFGIQLAGGYPNRMVPAAEVIAKELGHNDGSGKGVDFVDVNLGCPIDLVFNQGAGSALMDTPGRLGRILVGMNRALGEIPLTVKFRTGVASGKPNAHKLVPRFATEWGASGLTLHGRSRQQRYSKLANWAYIKQCVETLHTATDDAGLPRVPMFGNGDCYSAQQYWEAKEESGVDGVLVARGALIKPWIFTEIKERREWDISASERLDIVKQFAEFGLSHWGSDHLGVQTTRRFLCEYLSFTHRYIPIGLLERMPPQMNERPPPFKGRSELETLLASGDSRDWVKISEMFLGKVPESGWGWVPKHKSNAYGGEEAQG